MKAVQLLVNSYLPEDMRNYGNKYDTKDINKILVAVARKHPEKYAEVEKKLSDIGRTASYLQGATISLKDLEPVIDKKTLFADMDREIAALPKDEHFTERRREIFNKYRNTAGKLVAERALKNRNNIAMAVLSGARGKNDQLAAMIFSPFQYSDYKGEPVDVISRSSFAEGINPTVFLASTNGSRASVVSAKCLAHDTLVRMADLSERKICDIKPGEQVLGADREGHVFPVKVLNVFYQGEKECFRYKFRFSSGSLEHSEVVCTEDHKFLMVSSAEFMRKRALHSRGNGPAPSWEDAHRFAVLPAGRMRRGARCSAHNPAYPRGGYSGRVDEPWARIIGLLIGDGNLTSGGRITLSCADPILIGDITSELESLGHKIRKVGGDNYSWAITQDGYSAGSNRSIVKGVRGFVKGALNDRNRMLQEYGLLGHYAWEKRFPVGWQRWSRSSVADLIAGLFAADGSVFSTTNKAGRTQVGISFSVTSQGLIADLKLALSVFFGIASREERVVLTGGFGSSKEKRVHPIYTLEISRAEDVMEFWRTFRERTPGVKKFSLDKECSKIVIKQHNPYAKHMFHSKELVGTVRCFDIEVDHPDHLFVLANGLITSNSSTAKGGDIAKQFAASTADLTVRQEDCHTSNGIALDIDDKSLKGRALAQDVGGYKAGSFINADMLADLRKKGVKNVVARSALTCRADGGLCAHCVGKFFHGGKLPKVGDSVGLMASTSISEPVTQMALCLDENTMVRMADGSAKKIKDIVPGDMVVGADRQSNSFPVRVLNVFDQGEKECFVYRFDCLDGDVSIVATEDHKMLTERAVEPLSVIEKEEVPVVDSEGCKGSLMSKKAVGMIHCYDIEVDHPDHLFVLANGLITSNSAKHSAGMTKDKKSYSGIPALQQFTQSPEKYKDRAVVSELDGVVDAIEPADQGGTYITVSGKKHYIQPGHEPEVKVGDKVEAGDFLSEGLPDIEDTVRLKGLGAGRKLYATRLNQLLSDSGVKADPRNTEIIARGALRHVVVKGADGFGDYEPDDVIDYEVAEQSYKMPDTTQAMKPTAAVGKYLQAPFLHYTVGTRITPNVAKDLESNGYNTVYADTKTPEFEPEMVRLRTASHTTRDWLASLGTSYLTKQLQDSATRGDDTNILHNKDYRPRLAYGVGFGQNIEETGEF